MSAIVLALIPLIPQLIQAGVAGVNLVQSIRAAAQQSSAWTPEAEAAFLSTLQAAWNLPEWKPDAPTAS